MGSLRLATALLALAGLQSSVLGQCKTENFCTAFPNTTGSPALMGSNGLCAVPDNQFALQAGPVPNNFGLFFYSATVRNGGNGIPLGDGLLCIGEGAQLYRLPVLAAQNNQLDFSLDLTLPPAAGTIAAGTTWYFQAWYRDPGGAQSTFNFSDGLEVVFQAEQSPTVGFDLASQSLAEGDGSAILTVSLSSLSGLDVTVPYTVAGSASLPADGALAPDPLVIPAGSLSADLVLTLVDDGLDEADETVEVTLGAPTNAALGAGFVHTLTIQDNDVPPSVAFALMSASHGEGDGVAAALVELSAASGLDVSVPFTVTGSATVPDDLSVSASPLVIPAGQLSGAIQLNLVDDSFDEADESVELSLGAPTNASLGATIVHTATLTDDDAPPSVAFDQAVQVASEGAGVVGVTVVLSAISGQAVSVPFSVNGTADVPADATVDASPLVIPAGQLSGVIQVALVPDALNESAETVVLDLGAPTNASLGATATHTLTISDDDGLPTVSFASSSQSIGEAAGPQSVTVELSAVSGLDVTVPWTVSGTALDPDDVAVDDGPLVIPAGSLTGTFEVIPVSDGVDEPNETVVLDLGAPTNANKGAQDRHTVTILDDDAPPTITFTSAVQSAGEGAGAVAVAVQLDAPSGLEVSVPVLTSGAASVPGDATLSATTLVIPAGQQSANLTVTLVADSTFEADEELVLDLGAPSNATVGIPGQHTLTILDDDPAPQVAFSAPASSFAEGAGVVTVEVSLDTISGLDVTLPFSVGGSAGQPGDASVGASPVVVPAGVASATVSVTLVPDGLDEADETLVFDLGAPTGASLGTLTQHTLSIVDDDDPPAVTVTSSAQTAVEGAGGVTVTVALDGPSGLDVSVPFSATGSATAADVDVPASPVTITAGSTQTTLDLIVLQDVLDEPDEDLVVTLAAPTNGTLGSPFAHTLTIIDDDGPPSVAFVLANQSSGEGDGAITIDVSLSAVSGHAVTVPFTLAGDATPNVDYTADASPLVIPAGQTTGSITITPAADTSPESDETVELTLGAPTNATLGAPSVHVLTVLDDDVGLASDDFNDCAGLGSPWTFVDPLGGGTQRTTGVGTDDAWLRLGVPGGSNHEAFGGVLPARAQQPYPGGDTQFRASFPSSPSQAVEEQGLLVIEDTDYWIRFDVYHDGGELNAYVGRTTGASTTTMANLGLGAHSGRIDLRMTRSGDLWTAEWSADGATWNPVASFTFVFAPDQVGVYAGNAGGGNAPAFEASIDFFEVSADPILTEDGAFPGAGPYTMVTASAGTGSGVVQVSPDQPDYLCSDVVTLTAVPDAGSTFLGWQGDLSGTQNPIELVMSGDRTVTAVFAGDLDPPVISNVTVTPFSSGALITWDTDEPATSRVEFGLSAAYGAVVEDLTLVTLHSVVLEGLASSTTYHFQVLSADALGNLAMSADDTFETGPDSGLVSDDFNHCAGLIAPWSYIDPYADGSGYGVAGVGTDDAWMHLSVPGGANHDPYGAGLLPPRVSQPVFDVDFEFEVKFASDLTSTIQQQGVLIEQDADDWIRFDVYRSGSQNRAFVGSTVAGSTSTEAHATLSLMAPMHLRVTRVADDWTCWWSSDGSTWNSLVTFERVMAATQVSLYGGNSGGGGAPAHTAQVDWFQDTSKPIVTEDGSVAGSGPFTLTTNATGSGSVLAAPDQPDYLCTDVVDLTATPAGGWEFDHWEGDLTGSANPVAITLSANRSVTAVFTQDVTPPVISNLQVQVDQTSATFTWDTDEPATSIVNFGLTAGYGSTVMDPALGTSHMIVLDGLTPGTLYHYEVCSTDGAGLMACLPAATLVTQDGLGFVSDDFNTCAGLAGHWTFHDPGADGSLDVVGVGTDDAWMRLHVPAGSEHQAHDFLSAPYVSQTVNDVDFELETRLETVPSQQYEIQGLLVIEGPGSWLRFDVYHNGSELRMYAGRTIVNDTTKLVDVGLGAIGAPLWMRIRRVGDQWDQEYSVDGTNWFVVMSGVSHALDVNEVGLYVGNAVGVSSPAYVGAFDYVEDTAAPITDEDGFFGGSGPFTLTRSADPAFGGTLGASPDQVDYSCTDVVQVTATPAVGWQFSHWSGDLSGSSNPQVLSMSADRDVTAHFVQDIDPPVISNLAVSPGPTFATITWTTDEPADSSVDYGPDDGYGSTVLDTALVTDHVLLVGGLTPDTTYHFQVCSADLSGNTACTSDQTFTTNPDAGVVSDDFNAPNLNLGLWQFSDELGAAQAPRIVGPCTSDALLELRVPSGTEYLGWIVNDNVHVTQPVGNSDFELETKLETDFTGQYQSAGLIVIEDEDTWLRFDFQHTGSDLRILRASFDAGSATNYKATTVNAGDWVGAPLWMRVTRVGDQWSQAYSFDGNTWFGNGSAFGFVCAPTRVGLMAGNELPETNALGARFDYFFNSAAPLSPEDFQCPPSDTTEPLLVASANPASDSSITVDWSTDELSTGSVVWGTAPGVYDQGSLNGNPLVFEESLLIPGLLSETTYHFQVTAADGSGNSSLSPDFSATTPPFGFDGLPDVEVWYGTLNGLGEPVLRFGHLGDAQTWINVPGRVTDDLGGVVSLTYTLDNGAQILGPNALDVEGVSGLDNFRLVDAGDFNVELAQPDLADGLNELTLTATDTDGNVVNQTVWIDYDAGNVWPLPFSVDWSTVTDLQDAAQFVDGWFRIDSSSGTPMLRNIRDGAPVHGYDRLFAVGDETWTDYEFVVDFEVHSLNPSGFTPGSNSHAFGVIMRWPGHSGGTEQPQEEYFPLGGLMAYRWYTVINEHWNLYSTDFVPNIHESPFYLAVDEGVHYLLRGQVEDQPSGEIRYRARMWEVGSSEPTDWPLEMNVPAGGLSSGSLLFIVHDVDASIGNLTITPL